VSPGDQIGGVDKDTGVDYSTGYTYIEARYRNERLTNVFVCDDNGQIVQRNASQDYNGEEKKTREALVPAAVTAPPVTPPPATPTDQPAGTGTDTPPPTN
jgi:hypothetical protein